MSLEVSFQHAGVLTSNYFVCICTCSSIAATWLWIFSYVGAVSGQREQEWLPMHTASRKERENERVFPPVIQQEADFLLANPAEPGLSTVAAM